MLIQVSESGDPVQSVQTTFRFPARLLRRVDAAAQAACATGFRVAAVDVQGIAGGQTIGESWTDLTWDDDMWVDASDAACASHAKAEIEGHQASCDLLGKVLDVARDRRAIMNPLVVPKSAILDYDRRISLGERALWRACEQTLKVMDLKRQEYQQLAKNIDWLMVQTHG